MKIIILLNKNIENLKFLLESIKTKMKGKFDVIIFDLNNKIINIDEFEFKILKTSNFKNDFLTIIENEKSSNFLLLDENKYCYDEIKIDTINNCLKNEEIFCFSLSLGKNITFCSNMNCENIFIPIKEENDILFWDWSVHYMDFGYPFNLDGTIYRGKELYKFLKNINFNDTIELENNLQIFDNYPKNIMCCFNKNKIIELIFENKENITNFNIENLKIDRTKFIIKSKIADEIIN